MTTLDSLARCSAPIVFEQLNAAGTPVERRVACWSSDPDRCPGCADLVDRTQRRRVMEGLAARSGALLLTTTAPSFGAVHSSAWTKADEYRLRHLTPGRYQAVRMAELSKRPRCRCGARHGVDDAVLGTPINAADYDYVGEALWSYNAPQLAASTKRYLLRRAAKFGLAPADFSLIAAYERQRRGSLHLHVLISADLPADEMDAFRLFLLESWAHRAPTAALPAGLTAWLRSPAWAGQLAAHGLTAGEIPHAPIRGTALQPGTAWGARLDARVIEHGDGWGHHTAARYITKGLGAGAPSRSHRLHTLHALTTPQRTHQLRQRRAALIALGDHVLHQADVAALDRELRASADAGVHDTDTGELGDPRLRRVATDLDAGPRPDGGLDDLLTVADQGTVRREHAAAARSSHHRAGARAVANRINRLASGAGFTGTSLLTARWTSFATYRARMFAWAGNATRPSTASESLWWVPGPPRPQTGAYAPATA